MLYENSKRIAVLGSTGSIGQQALDVCRSSNYEVVLLSANRNIQLLEKQAREFIPRYVVINDESSYLLLKAALKDLNTTVLFGEEGLVFAVENATYDILLNSIVGIAGLVPTLSTLKREKTLALANKESLVVAGEMVMNLAKMKNTKILPVDSEHSAIFQCLIGEDPNSIDKILLTASGGPFWNKSISELETVTVEQAVSHPNWSMGKKISVDSATMMNKGFELIEASWLFTVPEDKIEILVHRESILHSAVQFKDGSIKAQLGPTDMKLPIQYALNYPNRKMRVVPEISLFDIGKLSFFRPTSEAFPCLEMAKKAIHAGGLMPCALNCANEECVEAFLNEKIRFTDIPKGIEYALSKTDPIHDRQYTMEDIIDVNASARRYVREFFNIK